MRLRSCLTVAMLVQPWLLGCGGNRTDAEQPTSAGVSQPPSSAVSAYMVAYVGPTVFGSPLPNPFSEDEEGSIAGVPDRLDGEMDCYHGHWDPTHWKLRPQRLSGGVLRLPPEAIAQHVHGVVIARCLVTVEGVLKDCRLIKSLPHMDAAVLDYLYRGRYSPTEHKGKPLAMTHTFLLKIPEQDSPTSQGAEDHAPSRHGGETTSSTKVRR